MTSPHEFKEKSGNREQKFDGRIDEIEYPSPIDTDVTVVRQLEAPLNKGDRIIIPSEQSPNPGFPAISLYVEGHDMANPKWDAPVKASVSIGGSPDGSKVYKPDNLIFISLKDAPYSFLPAYLAQYGTTPEEVDWLVIAEEVGDDSNMMKGQAFIKASQPNTTIGREGNSAWFKYGVETDQERWNPFLDNPSVAETHLMLTVVDGDLAITSQTDAPTLVNTRASKEHLQLLGT